jgi:hypothetical protein
MTSLRPSHPVVASLALVALAAAAGIATAQAPVPAPVTKPATVDHEVRVTRDREMTHAAAVATAQQMQTSTDTAAVAEATRNAVIADSLMASAKREETARRIQIAQDMAATHATAMAVASSRDAGVFVPEPPPPPLPLDTILAWITERRPDIIRGNPQVSSVAIVVDADEHFVSMSTTGAVQWIEGYLSRDAIEAIEVVKGPAAALIYGEAARNGVIAIRTKVPAATIDQIRTDSVAAAQYGVVSIGQANPIAVAQPVIYIDGVRVSPENIPVARVSTPRLGIDVDPQRIEAVDVLKLAGGTIGPNPLGVVVVKLKRD